MQKVDLKKAIKPIVKECISEVLIEEGLLSNVVSEVVAGLQNTNMVVETAQPKKISSRDNVQRKNQEATQKLNEHKKRMLDAIGKSAYNGVDLFEGTTPAPSQQEAPPGAVDLGNPHDSGVDISSLMGDASKIWKAMK